MTTSEYAVARRPGDLEESPSSGKVRLLPKVKFGLGAAVLAGVVVVTVPAAPTTPFGSAETITTTWLGAAINAVTGNGIFQTTCCGRQGSVLEILD